MANQRNLSSLKGDNQRVRSKPAIIFGTADINGACHGVSELIDNCFDEAGEGRGKCMRLTFYSDKSICVEDEGGGLPMHYNEKEGVYNWHQALCELYASEKYTSGGTYEKSSGTNGVGLAATQMASEFMDVESCYDGKTYSIHCEKGEPVGDLKIEDTPDKHSGTKIRFRLDPEVFHDLYLEELPLEFFLDLVRRKTMLYPGFLSIVKHYKVLNDDGEVKEIKICYPNGIQDVATAMAEHALCDTVYRSASVSTTDFEDREPYKLYMNMAFAFSSEHQELEMYHNNSWMKEDRDNVTSAAVQRAFTKAFNELGKDEKKLTGQSAYMFRDIGSNLIFIGSTGCPADRTMFKGQTKFAIANKEISKEYQQFVYDNLIGWFKSNRDQAIKVLNKIDLNRKGREEADKVSKKVIQKLSKPVGIGSKPSKLKECLSTDPRVCELYIIEGDSALSPLLNGRDAKFQALFPLRGKILNCLKNSITRALSSDVIIDLFRVLGCGMEVKNKKNLEGIPAFDINKLKYDKIIICTDADKDGYHIRCLCIIMFYVLCPTLLKEGKVYIAETPLYTINYGNKAYFAFDDAEKETILADLRGKGAKNKSIEISRSKGLGENTSEMMWDSTMNPETRRLSRIDYNESTAEIATLLNSLMGDDIEGRRLIIEQYFRQGGSGNMSLDT